MNETQKERYPALGSACDRGYHYFSDMAAATNWDYPPPHQRCDCGTYTWEELQKELIVRVER